MWICAANARTSFHLSLLRFLFFHLQNPVHHASMRFKRKKKTDERSHKQHTTNTSTHTHIGFDPVHS